MERPLNPRDFLNFDKFITPSLVTIIYWLGIASIVVSGLFAILASFSMYGGGISRAIGALVFIVFGVLMWRIVCEAIILSFRIYGRLTEIRDGLNRR